MYIFTEMFLYAETNSPPRFSIIRGKIMAVDEEISLMDQQKNCSLKKGEP